MEPDRSARVSRCRALDWPTTLVSLILLSKWSPETPTPTDRLYSNELRERGNFLRPNALRRCWIWMLQTVPFAFILSLGLGLSVGLDCTQMGQQQRKKDDSTSDSYNECNYNEQKHSQEH
ncbi:hypothetical protein YC2023_054458 [Brassica napus]